MVYPTGESITAHFIVMELASNGEMFDYLEAGGGLPERICRFYFKRLIKTIDFLKLNEFILLNIKPENLLLTENWDLKLHL